MLNRLSNFLYKVSTGWVALVGLLIFILFTILVLPGQSASSAETAGGSGSPDTSFFYSADDLYKFAEAYGQAGRTAYIQVRFTFDLLWPIVYTLFLVTVISWLGKNAGVDKSRWALLNLIPLAGMAFDYLENISTSIVMWRYPETTPLVDWMAAIFTPVKWLFVAGSFILLLVTLGLFIFKRIKSK